MKRKQLALGLKFWGGKRKGAGRKPRGQRAGISHRRKLKLTTNTPVHVTLKLRPAVANLRSRRFFRLADLAVRQSADKPSFRITQYSILEDHLHLLVEADSHDALERGITGLTVRLAKRLNSFLGRAGKVFKDRYHAHVLKTPREVYLGLKYILLNARKHFAQAGRRVAKGWVDPCSSATSFDGFRQPRRAAPVFLPAARGWLLRLGWRRYGLIGVDEMPAATSH